MTEMHGYSLNGLTSSFHPNNYNFLPVSDQSNLLILLIYTPWQWIMQKAIKYYHIIECHKLSSDYSVPLYGSNFHSVFRDSQKLVREYYQTKWKKYISDDLHQRLNSSLNGIWDLQCLSNKEYAPLRCRRAWGYWKYMWRLAINLVWSLHTKLIAHTCMLGFLAKQLYLLSLG